MKILIVKEVKEGEKRVAATPETVKRYIKLGLEVMVEKDSGVGSGYSDEDYKNAGAKIVKTEGYKDADIVVGVNAPQKIGKKHQADFLKEDCYWVSFLLPDDEQLAMKKFEGKKITAFSMNFIPRISRAQNLDALSSQSNIAGYKAVIMAANEIGKMFPLLMTAAGTIQPARVVILGAGVAGLQAIATAKRLGAVVEASDVRPAAKEQVESLGGKFIEVEFDKDSEDASGYAKEASKDFMKRQAEEVAKRVSQADVVITTALVQGKRAPVLITEDMVKSMKTGSVIVDLAVEAGGNCPLSVSGKTVEKYGVKIIGLRNIPSLVAVDATEMYSKNVLNFVSGMVKEGKIEIKEDEIYSQSKVTK